MFEEDVQKKVPDEQRWVTIVMKGIDKKPMLPPSVFATEHLGFQSSCRGGVRYGGRTNGPRDSVE